MRTLIVGASDKEERYANKAMKRLLEKGHETVLLHPTLREIDGRPVVNRIEDAGSGIDTVTLYVGRDKSEAMIDGILALRPRRIIANPGAESAAVRAAAEAAGIEYLEACTLVLLATGAF